MKINNIFKIIIVSLLVILLLSNVVYANKVKFKDDDRLDPKGFEPWAQATMSDNSNKITQLFNNFVHVVLTLVRIVAVGWAIVMLIYIAIKYILSSNPWKRNQLKVDLYTYVVGVIILFGAAGILKLVSKLVNDVLG